jgi:hypothetical protein
MSESDSYPSLTLPKKKARIVIETVTALAQHGIIDHATAARIQGGITPLPFDWRRLARYSFIVAIVCVVIALSAAVADEWIIKLFEKLVQHLFHLSWGMRSLICAILSGLLLALGQKRRRQHPEKLYSNEAIFFAGVLGIAGSIACLGKAIDTGSGHFSLLILLAALIYCVLGLLLESKLIWVFGLLSLGGWFGAETGYVSGWGAYCLGMAYPLRFVVFGLVLTLLSLRLRHWPKTAPFFGSTRVMGLLYLFIALWILSIWGNYDGYDNWHRASRLELFHWSLYFGAAAMASIYAGLKHDDSVWRGFGLTFLGINLYTRFFEFCWEGIHKAVFFAILAVSFWLIGLRAERLWNMQSLRDRFRSGV